ncbi:hypothetical protein PsorP6_011915 [Peronosclerospora sorghi]|uniref:Uncharacterized protein n=1 Tax=Peronosclerospora sorghi TaxID=230839 RepID=A0ACC0WLQ7_9STRA|nr:hypothetical protein PsorP6_011915 [Peronosclerospora sorghi]
MEALWEKAVTAGFTPAKGSPDEWVTKMSNTVLMSWTKGRRNDCLYGILAHYLKLSNGTDAGTNRQVAVVTNNSDSNHHIPRIREWTQLQQGFGQDHELE